MLGKDNLMTMVCSRSKSIQQPLILEKSTNRLLAYHPDKFINLTKVILVKKSDLNFFRSNFQPDVFSTLILNRLESTFVRPKSSRSSQTIVMLRPLLSRLGILPLKTRLFASIFTWIFYPTQSLPILQRKRVKDRFV
jgi:hypothetical protein